MFIEPWARAENRAGALLMALFTGPALAGQESPASLRPDIAAFAQAAVQSLTDAREAQEAVAGLGKGAGMEPGAAGLQLQTVYRNAILALNRAQSRLGPWRDHPSGAVVQASSGLVTAYSVVAQVLEADLRLEERLMDVGEDQSMDSLLADARRHRSMADEAWRSLPESADRLCRALIDESRKSPEGKPAFLVITQRERADLLKSIESGFPKGIAAGAADPSSVSTAAVTIARFLHEPWRASDQK